MEIVQSSLKELVWHKMQDDLASFFPEIKENNLLMCCLCGRFLPFESFTVEHIIPKQSLQDDPEEVRKLIPINRRGKILLLCSSPLKIKGREVHSLGCNSFKGKYYDKAIREVFNRVALHKSQFNSTHHISLTIVAYLATVLKYGYQIVLCSSGLIMRRQFFSPFSFIKNFPMMAQMVLMGDKPMWYDQEYMQHWSEPFSISIEDGKCIVVMRGISVIIPLSRDPRIPISKILSFVPSKFVLRPNFTTVFD